MIVDAVREILFELISSMHKVVGRDGKVYQHPTDFDWGWLSWRHRRL